MKKEIAKQKLQAGEIQIHFDDRSKLELLRDLCEWKDAKGINNYYCWRLKSSNLDYVNLPIIKISEITEEPNNIKVISEEVLNKPDHYAKQGIDTFSRMEANCTLSERLAFVKGNIDKYNFRDKGQDKEDFKKIIVYAKWAIIQLDKENK